MKWNAKGSLLCEQCVMTCSIKKKKMRYDLFLAKKKKNALWPVAAYLVGATPPLWVNGSNGVYIEVSYALDFKEIINAVAWQCRALWCRL